MAFQHMTLKPVAFALALLIAIPAVTTEHVITHMAPEEHQSGDITAGEYIIQWQKSYGKWPMWSARYEGPQPVGDADNDGNNELLIGGRDPFMRVMKWNDEKNTYYEQAKIIDPVLGIGYTILGFGSATGFGIADIDNDGKNEIGVAWGRHFSAFKWNGERYELMGRYIVSDSKRTWDTTLDCIIGDCDNDGNNEVVVTGGYSSDIAEVIVLEWDGSQFVRESEWNPPGRHSVYFPWIADVDEDGENELVVNTNQTTVLNWDGSGWQADVVAVYEDDWQHYPFGCVAKDSDGDGMPEIHVTFYGPYLKIYEYDQGVYLEKANFSWPNEQGTIEAIDVGDVDNDGMPEVVVGTNHVHILQWNGETYEEEYVITDTHGFLAVTCVGDMDNDGMLEINAGSVGEEAGNPYEAWIFKYEPQHGISTGNI